MNAILPPDAVMAYGWRIPFIVGLAVGLGGLLIRRHYVEHVPHQPPAKSPLGEAFRHHWRTILHLVALVAGIAVGFYTVFVYAATWLAQVAGVSARTAFEINTAELAPWRVRCMVLSIAYNLGMALLGGTTPLVAAWLVARTGVAIAPGVYLAAAGVLAFVAALLLPKTLPHRLTTEFHSVRPAEVG